MEKSVGESRLSFIRELMKERGYDAYLVPHNDAHDSEYLADHDERIRFISGFSGSYGMAVVTHLTALVWTDSRYWL